MNIREKNIKVSTVISFLIPIIIWAMLAYLAKLNLSLAFLEGGFFWISLVRFQPGKYKVFFLSYPADSGNIFQVQNHPRHQRKMSTLSWTDGSSF